MIIWLILFLLFVKHFLADFVWQTEKMVVEKGQYGKWGGIHHSLLHAVLTYTILIHVLGIQASAMLAVFDFIVHYHTDWAKMNIAKKLTVQDKMYWFWLGMDQLVHAVTYLVIGFTITFLLTN